MMKTIQGIVDDQGNIRLLEPIKLNAKQHVLVTVVEADDEEFLGGWPVTMLLARPALADWDRPEEDEAWKDFQDKAK